MDTKQHTELKFIPNVKETEVEGVFKGYEQLVKCNRWVRLSGFLVLAIIGGYNFFIAGKSYTISQHNTIRNVMAFIIIPVVLLLLALAITMFKRQGVVRKRIREIAQKHNFQYKPLKKEFNIVLKSFYGGSGI